MQKLSQKAAYWLGVIVVGIAFGFVLQFARAAWSEPTAAPVGNNVEPPLNISNTGQFKEGNLVIATNPLNPDGTVRANGLVVANGNVGIGTTSPQAKLDVAGGVRMGNQILCDNTTEGTQRYNSTIKIMEFCNGSVWVGMGFGGGSSGGTKTFVSNDVFNVPAGVTSVKITAVGGGGGGAGAWASGCKGGGGGSGGYVQNKTVAVTPGSKVAITVGSGGAADDSGNGEFCYGRDGGASSFGSFVLATGGKGAPRWSKPTASSLSTGPGGAGGSPSGQAGGDALIKRDPSSSNSESITDIIGGNGGSTPFGFGGTAIGSRSGNGYGSGGSGGMFPGSWQAGAGAPGFVEVSW